jgi:hypothetical protein
VVVSPSLTFHYPEPRIDDPDGIFKISERDFLKRKPRGLTGRGKSSYSCVLPNPAFYEEDSSELLQQRYHEAFSQWRS